MPTFIAYLPKSKTAIGIDGDGQSTVKLIMSEDQLPEVLKMTMFKGKTFRVTVEAESGEAEAQE